MSESVKQFIVGLIRSNNGDAITLLAYKHTYPLADVTIYSLDEWTDGVCRTTQFDTEQDLLDAFRAAARRQFDETKKPDA